MTPRNFHAGICGCWSGTKRAFFGATQETTVTNEEWAIRFKASIVARLAPHKPDGKRGPGWTKAQAEKAADDEYNAVEAAELMDGFENDPEGCAGECISYWGEG